jgi:hypothetical protein
MIGHLGARVSALLDGQLSPADEERAWEHVHSCHECRDAVEREGWVKTRLATMQLAGSPAPSHLKGSILVGGIVGWPELSEHPALADASARRRHLGVAGISSGAVGAAVMGVLALGASPANAPGGLVSPVSESFGTPLRQAVTTVIERHDLPASHARDPRDTPPAAPTPSRRLAR